MGHSALRISQDSPNYGSGIPDEPITYSIPYRPRESGAERHFGFFPFFAKKPWQVVQEYIKHYAPPGALVCDPFVGSGVTAVEALVLGRRAVATDINPVARFITQMTATAPVDLDALDAAYEQVRLSVSATIMALDDLSDAALLHALQGLNVPRLLIPPKVRRTGATTTDELHTPRQLAGLALLRDGINQVEDLLLRDLLRVALANTVRYANRTYIGRGSDDQGSPYRGNAGFLRRFSYSLASKNLFYEHRVWPTFELRYKAVRSAKDETNRLIGKRYNPFNFTLADLPAARIHEVIGEGTVDYCFTDPPYSDAIRFLDLSTLWAAWLDLPITADDRQAELLITTKPKSEDQAQFERRFSASAESIARVLKEDCWFTLVYKHSDLSLWQTIVKACEDAGLRFVNATWQDAGIASTRQIESPGVNPRGDMYMNFRKMTTQRFESIYPRRRIVELPTRANYIEHEAERTIVTYLGADIALITSTVVQQILNSRTFHDYEENPDKVSADLLQTLSGPRFTLWQPPHTAQPVYVMASGQPLDVSLDSTDRARYCLFELLRLKEETTEGDAARYLLQHLATEQGGQHVETNVAALLLSLAQQVGPHRWRFDVKRVTEYKQLRLFFKPSGADVLRQQIEAFPRLQDERLLQPNMEGLALLRDRLRAANSAHAAGFAAAYGRLLEVLQIVLLRLVSGYSDRIDQVIAVGEWADEGIDLRNLPYSDIVLDIVLRVPDRSFDLHWRLAEEVFTDLRDDDVIIQFRLSTVAEWQHIQPLPHVEGRPAGAGIVLLGRS